MTREDIDIFLKSEPEIHDKIRKIAENYSISDFIKMDKSIGHRLAIKSEYDEDTIYCCIYNVKNNMLLLDTDSVERRLASEYFDFLFEIFKTDETVNNILFYIVAYHYLCMCKQIGYDFTSSDNALFFMSGDKLLPRAVTNLNRLHDMYNEGFDEVIEFITEEDLLYFNNILRNCGWHHHSVKHFSLLLELLRYKMPINKVYFNDAVEKALDLFVFRYKAIFTTKRMFIYMIPDERNEIIENLVDYPE